MNLARRFLTLSAVRRHLLVRAAVLLWLTRLILVAVPFQRARRTLFLLIAFAKRALPGPASVDAAQLAWAVRTATRLGPRNCLVRALAAQALVELQGGRGCLVIGTRRNSAGALEAHAWLEHDGRIMVGAHNGPFTTIGRFERVGA